MNNGGCGEHEHCNNLNGTFQCLCAAPALGCRRGCPLLQNGSVQCWGSSTFYGETTVPPGLPIVTAVSAGVGYSLARLSDGTLIDWGNELYVMPSDLGSVASVVAHGDRWSSGSERHACAVLSTGGVRCWGFGGGEHTVYNAVPVDLPPVATGPL